VGGELDAEPGGAVASGEQRRHGWAGDGIDQVRLSRGQWTGDGMIQV
jgi:hypothetical protein